MGIYIYLALFIFTDSIYHFKPPNGFVFKYLSRKILLKKTYFVSMHLPWKFDASALSKDLCAVS